MTFASVSDRPVAPRNHVGVAIKHTGGIDFPLHVGLVFTLTDGRPWMAHLAFHEKLRGDAAPRDGGYFWADCRWILADEHAETGPYIANFIQGTLRNRSVPYGLVPDLDCFATGTYAEDEPRYGLTCATYVVAALKGAGIDLVDVGTWVERPGDEEWSKHVIEALRTGAPERAALLEGQRAPFRVTPDEAAAAAEGAAFPVTMAEASEGATALMKVLRSAFPP